MGILPITVFHLCLAGCHTKRNVQQNGLGTLCEHAEGFEEEEHLTVHRPVMRLDGVVSLPSDAQTNPFVALLFSPLFVQLVLPQLFQSVTSFLIPPIFSDPSTRNSSNFVPCSPINVSPVPSWSCLIHGTAGSPSRTDHQTCSTKHHTNK